MIVKNEAAWLLRCLVAAKPFVDEMVVVDTGSTDATVEVAKTFGAKVSTFPWCDDFAAARNHSLELASGDWILHLDADELLRGPSVVLRQLAKGNKDGYQVAIFNYFTGGEAAPEEIGYAVRFFRNDATIRFQGRVHETPLIPSERLSYAPPELQIHHYGYTSEKVRDTNKRERNLRLLQLEVAEETDPMGRLFQMGNLGVVYLNLHRHEDALAVYAEMLRDPLIQGTPLLPVTLLHRLLALKELGRFADALEETGRILGQFPEYAEVWRWRGFILARQGQPTKAAEAYRTALRQPRHRPWLIRSDLRTHAVSWFELGTLCAAAGQFRLSTQCLAEAAQDEFPVEAALPRLEEVLRRFPPDQLAGWLPLFFRNYPSLRPLLEPGLKQPPEPAEAGEPLPLPKDTPPERKA